MCDHDTTLRVWREDYQVCLLCDNAALMEQNAELKGRIAALEMELSMWRGAVEELVNLVKMAAGNLKAMENKARDRLRVAEGKSE